MELKEGTFRGAGGVELFYRKIMKSSGTAKGVVIAVHGHGDHSGGLRNLTDKLAENDYIVYAHDLRGHGNSPGTRGFIRKWEEYRGDLNAFRELVASETEGLPLFIAGHSLGGVISADYSLIHGQGLAGIVLIAPAISYEAPFLEKCLVAAMGLLKPEMTVHKASNPDSLTRDTELCAKLASDPLRHNTVTPGLGRGLMQIVARIRKHSLHLEMPLLLQYGLADDITPPGKLREFYATVGSKDKQYYEYKDVRHRPFDDLDRERFAVDLTLWLNRQTTARQ